MHDPMHRFNFYTPSTAAWVHTTSDRDTYNETLIISSIESNFYVQIS